MKRTATGLLKRMLGALAGLMVAAAFVPAVASAGGPVARLTMYEVLEALQFKKPIEGTDPQQFARRFAEAALLGNQVVPLSANPIFLASNYSGARRPRSSTSTRPAATSARARSGASSIC